MAEFLEHCLLRGKARVDFRGLAPQLALEFQYAMQCRRDKQTVMTPPAVVGWAIRRTLDAGVASLLDLASGGRVRPRGHGRGPFTPPGCPDRAPSAARSGQRTRPTTVRSARSARDPA